MHLYLSLSLTLIIPVKPFSAMVGQSTCYSPLYILLIIQTILFFYTFYCFEKKVGTAVNHDCKVSGAYQRLKICGQFYMHTILSNHKNR